MLPAPSPADERERLDSLRALSILDTPSEERFDRITRIAVEAFGVPIALVSLVDSHRQWFKSCIGLDVSETGRDISFCGHAIASDETLIVEDAAADERFADNPLVTDGPKIRFYAGHPLRSLEGHRLGTLCIIDRRPRRLSESQRLLLHDLAALAEEELGSLELQRAEHAREESATRLEAVMEAVIDGLVTIDPAGQIESFNTAAERIFGYRREEVIGSNVNMLMPEPYRSEHDGYLARYDQGGEARVIATGREVVGLRKDGSTFPMDLAISQMELAGRRRFIGTVRDITERKRAEEERRRFFSLSLDMLCIAGFDGYFKDLNPAWTAAFGYSLEELTAKPFIEFVHPDDRESTIAEAARLAEGGSTVSFENRYLAKDGSFRWLLWSATSLPEQSLMYAVARDITERKLTEEALAREVEDRKRVEEALRTSEELHRSVVAAMEEGILLHDEMGTIVSCNASAERILGLPADEINGTRSVDSGRGAVREDGTPFPETEHPAMVTLEKGEPCSNVIVGVSRPTGELRWLSVNSQPLLRPGKTRPYAAVASFADVTEQRAVERMKDEFVSVVSHELRTPLTSIRGALGLLASGAMGALPEKAEHMLTIAVTNSDRLIRLINDILDIERMESGEVAMVHAHTRASDLLERVVEVMRPIADEADVTLAVEPLETTLWVDSDRIVQALTNLVGNAVKFSPAGGTVRVSAAAEGDHAVFRVEDEGRGIPEEKLETIFDRFQQVDASDSREKGGTGLGLAISRSIVEQHDGRIWVESEVGRGSTFAFSIPLAGGQAIREGLPRTVGDGRLPRVLVCDDDAEVRTVVAALLEQSGYEVLTAGDGDEAIELARTLRPDVVLLDLLMPGRDGWSAMAGLKDDPATADLPVVIVSGVERKAAPAEAAPADWVRKPFDGTSLLTALERVLSTQSRVTRVLVVEDDVDLARVLLEIFARHDIEALLASTVGEAIALSDKFVPDLLVLDLVLPDGDGFGIVDWLRRHDRLRVTPLVVYTAQDLSVGDRERLRLGETEFLVKGRVTPEQFEHRVVELLSRIAPHATEAAA